MAAAAFDPNRSRYTDAGEEMNRCIDAITTPAEFEAKRRTLHGYSLEDRGINGTHALCSAAVFGNIDLVGYLAEQGGRALVNRQNQLGWTPLYFATHYETDLDKRIICAKILLDHRADPSIQMDGRNTPLHNAVQKLLNLPMTRILLSYGADPTIRGYSAYTEEHTALIERALRENEEADQPRLEAALGEVGSLDRFTDLIPDIAAYAGTMAPAPYQAPAAAIAEEVPATGCRCTIV